MTTRNTVLLCALTTLLLCLLWAPRLRMTVAFADPVVRPKAAAAIETLRRDGLWLVNADLAAIERRGDAVCFTWDHQYRSRTEIAQPESLTTCL